MRRALLCCLLVGCTTKTDELGPGGSPRLTIQPGELSFGPVRIGTGAEKIVALVNESGVPLDPLLLPGSVGPCGPEPEAFCVAQDPGPIPAGATGALTVRFTPSRTGPTNGLLLLGACAASGCEAPVALSGEGVEGRLVCDNAELDLGELSLGSCAEATLSCTNRGQVEAELRGVTLSNEPGFRLVGPTSGVVRPGESRDLQVEGCAQALGAQAATITIDADPPATRSVRLFGVDPVLVVEPTTLEFGEVVLDDTVRRPLTLRNQGTTPLRLISVAGSDPSLVITGAPAEVAPNAAVTVEVALTANQVGPFTLAVVVQTNDTRRPRVEVPATGSGLNLPECGLLQAQPVEIGPVEIGRRGSGYLRLENLGTEECLYGRAAFAPGTEVVWALEAPANAQPLAPGGVLPILVHLEPEQLRTYQAQLEVVVNGRTIQVAVNGEGSNGFLRVVPEPVDFDGVTVGCEGQGQVVHARLPIPDENATLLDAQIIAARGGAFRFAAAPILPGPVDQPLTVLYTPTLGKAEAELVLRARVHGVEAVSRVPIKGEGRPDSLRREQRELPLTTALDVLFVLDHSCSNFDDISQLRDNAADYLTSLDGVGVDYHLAVTTTDIDTQQSRGRFAPAADPNAPRVVTPALPTPAPTLESNFFADQRFDSGAEAGIEAAHLATVQPLRREENAGWLRRDASLVLFFFSDEDDQSPNAVEAYADIFRALRPIQDPNQLRVVSVVGDVPGGCTNAYAGTRYVELADRLGGAFSSFCGPNAADALFTAPMLGFAGQWDLAGDPEPNSLVLRIDGVVVPEITPGGASNYTYDGARRRLTFSPLAIPDPGSVMELEYQAACR
ncbi:MAG: choice-of-anchor D domain-containing protein [Deltaproteobacteria bacterium]|nr:choice-of-anchor D domain-containing protein [Deltaproteobacteria bacterium]